MGEHQRQPVLARFGQDGREAVGGEVLELVGVQREVAAIVFRGDRRARRRLARKRW